MKLSKDDLKSLPGYKAAESYLSKRSLNLEKAKILYRRLRPSADEREFRRRCLAKFGHGGVAVLKPSCSLDSDFADFVATFEVEGEKFSVAVLSKFYCDGLDTFQANKIKHTYGKLIELEEYRDEDGQKGLRGQFSCGNGFGFIDVPDGDCSEEDAKRAFEASQKIFPEVEVEYEEPDLRALARIKREKRLGFLVASELFLGPKAVWVNKNEFPN